MNLYPYAQFLHDVGGNSPAPSGPFVEGRTALTFGLQADYLSRWQADLAFTRYGGEGNDLSDATSSPSPSSTRSEDRSHDQETVTVRRRPPPRVLPCLHRIGRDPRRSDRAARRGPHSARRGTRGQRRREHPGMDRRHHQAAGRLQRGRAPPRPLCRGRAALGHRRRHTGQTPRPAFGRAPTHAGGLSELQDAGLSDPAQRVLPAAHLRCHPKNRRHREARGRWQRRGRRGHRHPLPDSA